MIICATLGKLLIELSCLLPDACHCMYDAQSHYVFRSIITCDDYEKIVADAAAAALGSTGGDAYYEHVLYKCNTGEKWILHLNKIDEHSYLDIL